MTDNLVYFFSSNNTEGCKAGKNILGGKGCNLIEMARIGIPVPPGMVITTQACNAYSANQLFPAGLSEDITDRFSGIEKLTGQRFGDQTNPLLVSIRSGAPVSMPGMMDTILNLGLNEATLTGLIKATNDERFARDCYRRFIQMYGNVVLEISMDHFDAIINQTKSLANIKLDTELTIDHLKTIIHKYKNLVKEKTGSDFPEDVQVQLRQSIEAVFRSWNNERATYYRRLNHIPDELGTAVIIQAMVFGNMGPDCATGVAFTRNPSTGENKFYGEYLNNAQGEDVVAGIRTPRPIEDLENENPGQYRELFQIQKRLEQHFGDMQDIEFTIQKDDLYLLQTRIGKRTGAAALRIAVEMVREGLINEKKALMQIDPEAIPSILAPIFDMGPKSQAIQDGRLLALGLPAGPGAGCGRVAFSTQSATELYGNDNTILVRQETSPEDIMGMEASQGILTARGGMTSHAAVVARGMNKPCIVGCAALHIDMANKNMQIEQKDGSFVAINEGDMISIDGGTGEILLGELPTSASEIDMVLNGELERESQMANNFKLLMQWADVARKLKVRANADTPRDAKRARNFGAEGIGLCRTEHMFFDGKRILIMREMILANSLEEREKALDRLLPFQRKDFADIFEVMNELPVTIRLLDPPLHEFLPTSSKQDRELARHLNLEEKEVHRRTRSLHEENPMLGHRGCRLGITFPEITRMQTQAIIEAALEVKKKGISVRPEIMVPLVGHATEFHLQKKEIDATAQKVMQQAGVTVDYMVGTMIEIPRAAVRAHDIAKEAEFFSFGTNDLTQMTLAFSRDDSGSFLDEYLQQRIYDRSPFQTLDTQGVGELIRIAVERGKKSRPDIKLGICGEHGGDPGSIDFFHDVGLHYVSCSPYRIAVARLAAARKALRDQNAFDSTG